MRIRWNVSMNARCGLSARMSYTCAPNDGRRESQSPMAECNLVVCIIFTKHRCYER